jgi:hypothetical protein
MNFGETLTVAISILIAASLFLLDRGNVEPNSWAVEAASVVVTVLVFGVGFRRLEVNREKRLLTRSLINEYVSRDFEKRKILAMRVVPDLVHKKSFDYPTMSAWIQDNHSLDDWVDVANVIQFWSKLSRAKIDGELDEKLARRFFSTRYETHYCAYLKALTKNTTNPHRENTYRYKDYFTEHIAQLNTWLVRDVECAGN